MQKSYERICLSIYRLYQNKPRMDGGELTGVVSEASETQYRSNASYADISTSGASKLKRF